MTHILIAAMLTSLALPGLAGEVPKKAQTPATPATSVATVKFENKLVDGKKTWLPSVVKLKVGQQVQISATNTLDEVHGFEIPGYVAPAIVDAHKTTTFTITAKTKGVLPVNCQLHPAHVGAKIIVE